MMQCSCGTCVVYEVEVLGVRDLDVSHAEGCNASVPAGGVVPEQQPILHVHDVMEVQVRGVFELFGATGGVQYGRGRSLCAPNGTWYLE